MIHDLRTKHCVPCEGGVPPFTEDQIKEYLPNIDPAWKAESGKLGRQFKFKDFTETMAFVNRVADIAEAEGHHPDLHIFYNKLTVELSTHAIKGLSENDFILAAKVDELLA